MSEQKEYDLYFNVGATQHVKVTASSPEEALENADCYASLCYHCSRDGLQINDGDDFCIELDGEVVLEENTYENAFIEIERLKQQVQDLNKAAKQAFWWSAEFTATSHDNKILNAWEDFLTHPHAAPLDGAKA